MKNRFVLILLAISTIATSAISQDNAYVVFLADKANSPYNINQPEDFLSGKSITRRVNQGLLVTEQDLPVNPQYLSELELQGVNLILTSKWFNAALITCDQSLAESLKLLPYVSSVEYVAPDGIVSRTSIQKHNKKVKISDSDTLFQNSILGVSEMHTDGYQGEGMLIGVIDGGFTGVDDVKAFQTLRDEGRITYTYDFVGRSSDVYQYSDHGTKVLSLMATEWPEKSMVGVAPKANYVLLITEKVSSEYRVEEYLWAIGAERADSVGVDIITTSLGYNLFDDPTMNYQPMDMDGSTAPITRAAQYASEKGIVVVTSAGNEGGDTWQTITAPADIIDGIAVGSIQANYRKSIFSSIGPSWDGRVKPDVVALGSGAYLVNGSGNLVTGSGTSFSAPQVAGLVAGFWQANPQLTAQQILNTIRSSSDQYNDPNNELGYGIPSYDAMQNFIESENQTQQFAVYPNPVAEDGWLRIRVKDPVENSEVKVSLMDASGKLIQESSVPFSWKTNEYVLEMTTLPSGIYLVNLQSNDTLEKLKIVKI